ncbi:MAG: hypothetical protein MZW92_11075 [Comamonadaceae bacterium]|nr:hypothetical protein [Comamonadaceae bacterium]
MAATRTPAPRRDYFVPAPSHWPMRRLLGAAADRLRRRRCGSTAPAGRWMLLGSASPCWSTCCSAGSARSSRESEGGYYGRARRRLVPLGHGLVHLLRGDVLRRVLRRAVLRARARAADARQPRPRSCCGPTSRLWPSLAAPPAPAGIVEPFSADRPVAAARRSTPSLLLTSGVDADRSRTTRCSPTTAPSRSLWLWITVAARRRPSSACRPTSTCTPTAT